MTDPVHPAHPAPSHDPRELVRKGLLALTLAMLGISVVVAYLAVNDILVAWLQERWVPVWRAGFALAVGATALWVLARLTGHRPW